MVWNLPSYTQESEFLWQYILIVIGYCLKNEIRSSSSTVEWMEFRAGKNQHVLCINEDLSSQVSRQSVLMKTFSNSLDGFFKRKVCQLIDLQCVLLKRAKL